MRRFVSFFSGVGGFELGLQRAGWTCVGACEKEPAARAIYQARFGTPAWFPDDVTKITPEEIPEAEMWAGGWPCQSNSVAGKREGLANEAKSGLWLTWQKLIAARRPRIILGENVPGLLSVNGGEDWELVLDSIAEIGYLADAAVLDARFFGVAQRRRRVFVVCRRVEDVLDGDGHAAAAARLSVLGHALEAMADPAREREWRRLRTALGGGTRWSKLAGRGTSGKTWSRVCRGGGAAVDAADVAALAGADLEKIRDGCGLCEDTSAVLAGALAAHAMRLGGVLSENEEVFGDLFATAEKRVEARDLLGRAERVEREAQRLLGTLAPAAAVLPDAEGGGGDPAQGGEAGADAAAGAGAGADRARIASATGNGFWTPGIVGTVSAGDAGRRINHMVYDADEDGETVDDAGDDVDDVEVFQQHGSDVGRMGTLRAGHGDVQSGVPFVQQPDVEAFQCHGSNVGRMGTIRTGHDPGDGVPFVLDPTPTAIKPGHAEPEAFQCHGGNVGPAGTLRTNHNVAGGIPFLLAPAAPVDDAGDPMVFESRIARNGRGAPAPLARALGSERGGSSGTGDGAPIVFEPRMARGRASTPGGTVPTLRAEARPGDAAPMLLPGEGPASEKVAFNLRGGQERGNDDAHEADHAASLLARSPKQHGNSAGTVVMEAAPGTAYNVHAAESGAKERHAYETDHARCLDGRGGFASGQGGTLIAGTAPVPIEEHVNALTTNMSRGHEMHPERAGSDGTLMLQVEPGPVGALQARRGGAGPDVVDAQAGHLVAGGRPMSFSSKDHGQDIGDDIAPTLRAGSHNVHANSGVPPAVFIPGPDAEQVVGSLTNLSGTRSGYRTGSDEAAAGHFVVDEAPPPQGQIPFNVVGSAQQGRRHAYETDVSVSMQSKGGNPTGNEAGTIVMMPPPPTDGIRDEASAITASAGNHGHSSPRGDKSDNLLLVEGDSAGSTPDLPRLRAGVGHETNVHAPSSPGMAPGPGIRRLTPVETERLMSLPDGWTCICGCEPYSTAACTCADGNRYRAVGNSVVVNVIHWIGLRLAPLVEDEERVATA